MTPGTLAAASGLLTAPYLPHPPTPAGASLVELVAAAERARVRRVLITAGSRIAPLFAGTARARSEELVQSRCGCGLPSLRRTGRGQRR